MADVFKAFRIGCGDHALYVAYPPEFTEGVKRMAAMLYGPNWLDNEDFEEVAVELGELDSERDFDA
ncbi:MAG: hypothetical protein HQL69_20500 [Magnetococcales bacterium]|nr:hypothetical protein [Magnetococcales bacterium]